jgi:hypothetical protein
MYAVAIRPQVVVGDPEIALGQAIGALRTVAAGEPD